MHQIKISQEEGDDDDDDDHDDDDNEEFAVALKCTILGLSGPGNFPR